VGTILAAEVTLVVAIILVAEITLVVAIILAVQTIDMKRQKRTSGFTLIELLAAIAIFAIMSAMAYRGLSAVLDTRKQLEVEQQKWRDVILLFARMEQDFASAVQRPIRDTSDNTAAAFIGKPDAVGDSDGQVVFTRMGFSGQRGSLTAPQRMGYRFRDNKLEHLSWPVLDQAPRTAPVVGTLVENIREASFRFLEYQPNNSPWQNRWPQQGTPPVQGGLPAAVEVSITLTSGENLKRVFLVQSAQ
jgi:general secretion pathway protein J